MTQRSTHFLKAGTKKDFQCGSHVRTLGRPVDGSDVRSDPWLVDCGRCRSSKAWKDANQAKIDAIRERHELAESGGFDPDKPLSEMSKEEVLAFIAWRDSQKKN